MSPDSRQSQLSAPSRGLVDHFCFTCDEYVRDCRHLTDERLAGSKTPALEPSGLQSLGYDGKVRVLEIEFRVTTPYAYDEMPLPPPPNQVQYFDVPRYVFTSAEASKGVSVSDRANRVRTAPNLPVQ